jgi:hypothetical protein
MPFSRYIYDNALNVFLWFKLLLYDLLSNIC